MVDGRKQVAVVGLGYVGYELAKRAVRNYRVIGIDSSGSRLKEVAEDAELTGMTFSGEISSVETADYVVLTLPTPVNAENKPELTNFWEAGLQIVDKIKAGTTLIVESTVGVGDTRKFSDEFARRRGWTTGVDFNLCFSPERIDPANATWNFSNTPKIVAGATEECLSKAIEFYNELVEAVVEAGSLEEAEFAKLLENVFRQVNIGLANELAAVASAHGLTYRKIVSLASSKPFGFMPFTDSIGVGGHCIPVDPWYLVNSATRVGVETRLIRVAHEVNKESTKRVVDRACTVLRQSGGSPNLKTVLVCGVAYKAGSSDVRNSPSTEIISSLRAEGHEVVWLDNMVSAGQGPPGRAKLEDILENSFDLILMLVDHADFRIQPFEAFLSLQASRSVAILDFRQGSFA